MRIPQICFPGKSTPVTLPVSKGMDRITQLQDAIDQVKQRMEIDRSFQMATQFYLTLNYLNTHHDFAPVNDQPPVGDAQG
jgi:hypothetical protein